MLRTYCESSYSAAQRLPGDKRNGSEKVVKGKGSWLLLTLIATVAHFFLFHYILLPLCPLPACFDTSPADISLAPSFWTPPVFCTPTHALGPTGKSGSFQCAPSAGPLLCMSPSPLENPFGVYMYAQELNVYGVHSIFLSHECIPI